MDRLGLIFLGIIAALAVMQTVVLFSLYRESRQAARRLDRLAERLGRDIEPGLTELSRAARNLAELSERAVVQARRVDRLLSEGATVAEKGLRLAHLLLPVGGRVAAVAIGFRFLRKARRVFRYLRRVF